MDENVQDIHGLNALHLTSGRGHNAVVKELIAAGANINASAASRKGWTALQAAARGGHIDVVNTLIDAGANVNSPHSYYDDGWRCMSALQVAVAGGHADVAEKVLEAGASTPDSAALRSAVRKGHLGLVKILLQSKGEWTKYQDALLLAVNMGHLEIFKTLLKSGFPFFDDSLFTESVQSGNIEILKALIDACIAKGWSISYLGSIALEEAAAKGNLEMVDAKIFWPKRPGCVIEMK